MTDNPYQASLVPAWTPPVQERPGISILAIFLGLLTDIGGSTVVGFVLSVVFSAYLLSQGTTFDELAIVFQSPTFWIPGAVLGLGLTFLGGFVAGRVARRSELLHGAITGSISGLFGFLMQLWQAAPLWYATPSLLIVPPTAMLGAHLSKIGRRRQQIA